MSNHIHPSAIIGEDVELGNGNTIGPFSVICGPAVIGDNNWIGAHATIGTPAESRDVSHLVDWTTSTVQGRGVRIGQHNILREYTSIQQGTVRPTAIGDHCYLMRGSYIAHDVLLDDAVTLSAGTLLAGHAHVWRWANIGMYAMVHQHSRVGPGAMVGMGAAVRREAEGFMISVGVPARSRRMNVVGLSRLGCDEQGIDAIEAYLGGAGALPDTLPEDIAPVLKQWCEREPLDR